MSSHHTRTRSYLFVCHPTSCFAQKRKPLPPTPKRPPTCAHIPQPCSLPLITGSALPWLLLLLPWKSSTNPVEQLCVLDLRWRQESQRPIICCNSSEGKGLVVIMRKYLEEQRVRRRSSGWRKAAFYKIKILTPFNSTKRRRKRTRCVFTHIPPAGTVNMKPLRSRGQRDVHQKQHRL